MECELSRCLCNGIYDRSDRHCFALFCTTEYTEPVSEVHGREKFQFWKSKMAEGRHLENLKNRDIWWWCRIGLSSLSSVKGSCYSVKIGPCCPALPNCIDAVVRTVVLLGRIKRWRFLTHTVRASEASGCSQPAIVQQNVSAVWLERLHACPQHHSNKDRYVELSVCG